MLSRTLWPRSWTSAGTSIFSSSSIRLSGTEPDYTRHPTLWPMAEQTTEAWSHQETTIHRHPFHRTPNTWNPGISNQRHNDSIHPVNLLTQSYIPHRPLQQFYSNTILEQYYTQIQIETIDTSLETAEARLGNKFLLLKGFQPQALQSTTLIGIPTTFVNKLKYLSIQYPLWPTMAFTPTPASSESNSSHRIKTKFHQYIKQNKLEWGINRRKHKVKGEPDSSQVTDLQSNLSTLYWCSFDLSCQMLRKAQGASYNQYPGPGDLAKQGCFFYFPSGTGLLHLGPSIP